MRWPFLLWVWIFGGVGVATRGTMSVCGSVATDWASLAQVDLPPGCSVDATDDAGEWVWVRSWYGSAGVGLLPMVELTALTADIGVLGGGVALAMSVVVLAVRKISGKQAVLNKESESPSVP